MRTIITLFILSLRYSSEYNLTFPEYFPENKSLLMPGGEGYTHDTGKDDDGYCIQYPNKTSIMDEMGQPICLTGFGEEVIQTVEYKWLLNWIEIYERLEGPFEGTLRYINKEEAPDERPELDFVKPKFYLPADAWPAFELSMYKGEGKSIDLYYKRLFSGTPRRIGYTMNNTRGAEGYNPPICYVDWPPGNLMKPCLWK